MKNIPLYTIPFLIWTLSVLSHAAPSRSIELFLGDESPSHYEPLTQNNARTLNSASIHRATLMTNSSLAAKAEPRAASNLGSTANALAFIKKQMQGTAGLPKSFDVPAGVDLGNKVNHQRIREGVNLYDSALAVWTLVENNQWQDARTILTVYAQGNYNRITLKASGNAENGYAFPPFNDNITSNGYFLFNTTRASGEYEGWDHYDVHAGPNAWMALACARYLDDARKNARPVDTGILRLAEALGQGLMTMQNNPVKDGQDHGDSQGGVRFGPIASTNGNAYNEINTENNLSAYAAFKALYKVTGNANYLRAAERIETFLSRAEVYNPETRRTQRGLLSDGGDGSMLYRHVKYNPQMRRWEIEPLFAADSAGTWALSALGADKIDQLFGPSKAQAMWATTRANFGRGIQTRPDGTQAWTRAGRWSGEPMSGIDFSRDWKDGQGGFTPDPSHVVISFEWTAGAVFAEQEVLNQCARVNSAYCTSHTRDLYQRDIASMKDFLAKNAGAYATGPGLTSSREGATGFSTFAPPEPVTSMASIYSVFKLDPLAWARN